jgi:hypothetical protein
MLKWLRKYNTYILVVGGCLLMVAWLLGSSLEELSHRGFFGGAAFRYSGGKVSMQELQDASRDYNAAAAVVGGQARELEAYFRIESPEHWLLLAKEAEEAGLVGGKTDGEDYLAEIPAVIASMQSRYDYRVSYDQLVAYHKARIEAQKNSWMAQAHLTEDQFYKAVARLHGIRRLQSSYYSASQFGEKRLITEGRGLGDTVKADYVLIPAEREIAAIPEPDEAAIKAHFEKYKDTPKGGGDFGIGYTLPARVKLAWMEINRQLIADQVQIDEIEAEKRFQRKYVNGIVGDGKNADDERKKFEAEVRGETADKAMKTAIDTVRAEIDKATRTLERDGEFFRVPSEWDRRPDFQKIREIVAARLLDDYKVVVPAPKVVVRAGTWVAADEVNTLEGIGFSSQQRGQATLPFSRAIFEIREIAGTNDLALQVGVPPIEPFRSGGNAYFFMVLDARKPSPPDSIEEVRADIVRNIKRLAAYETLKGKESQFLSTAVSGGLDALTKSATDPLPLTVREVVVSKKRTIASDESLDTQDFRDKTLALANTLDPAVDPASLASDKKTYSALVPKSLSVFVGKIKGLQPLTLEQFRTRQNAILANVQTSEFMSDLEAFPFSLENMEKRLDVKYEENREKSRAERKAERAAEKAKTGG